MDKLEKRTAKLLSMATKDMTDKDLEIIETVQELEDSIDEKIEVVQSQYALLDAKLEEIKEEVKKKSLEELSYEIDPEAIRGLPGEPGKPGKDGENYVITPEDRIEIANSIKVPIVEKVIERTEVIREPIVTQNTEVIELAVTDEPEVMAEKLNTLKEAVEGDVIKGWKDLNRIARENGAKTYTGVSETRVRELISAIPSPDIPAPVVLETNGTPNGSQSLLNLVEGTNMTITDDGMGNVTFDGADLSGYVPYTGATADVNLGTNGLVANDVSIPAQTASRIAIFDGSKNVISADTATYPSLTELSYSKGVTSAIQTQLNSKGSGTVTSVATDSTLAGGPITTTGTLGINLGNANTWTALQTIRLASKQQEWQYDSSNKANITVGSAGGTTLDTAGTDGKWTFKQGGTLFLHSSGTQNVFLGLGTGNATTTQPNNVGIGFNALQSVTTGSYGSNIAIGSYALQSDTTGDFNIAMGTYSLGSNTTGARNIAIGYQTLTSNTSGDGNVGLGSFSLLYNTTGTDNLAIGYAAMYKNTTGYQNVGIGYGSLNQNTTGIRNLAIGASALSVNKTGSNNIAIGNSAMTTNDDGYSNVSIGASALGNTVHGIANTSIGSSSLGNSTSDANVAIGVQAGYSATTADHSIVIGSYVDLPSNTATGQLNIGNVLYGTGVYSTNVVSSAPTSAGKIGIGTASPSARLHIISASNLFRVGYDASNYFNADVSSTGGVTLDAVGSGASFNFSDKVNLSNPINTKNYTVVTLPAGVMGDRCYVTDATAPAFLATLVGGGSVVCPAFYDGTNWVAA